MTDKEKLDKLVAEIKRLKKHYEEGIKEFGNSEYINNALMEQCKMKVCKKLLSFIDSMQEEPKEKCKGCNNVKGCITCVDGSEYAHIEECNITGIKSKHAIGKLKELVDNISEEGLTKARKQLQEDSESDNLEQTIDTYLATYFGGEKEKQDWPFLKKMAIHFANWQKQQMMKDAIDTIVKVDAGGYPYVDRTIELYDYDKDIPLAKKGDKVKIVVIKED